MRSRHVLSFFEEVTDGIFERGAEQGNAGGCQMDRRCAAASPSSVAGTENMRGFPYELLLLRGSELDHPVLVVGVAQCRKNPALQPKIGMAHVRRLRRAGNAQGQ